MVQGKLGFNPLMDAGFLRCNAQKPVWEEGRYKYVYQHHTTKTLNTHIQN